MLSFAFDSQEKRMLQYLLPRDSTSFSRYFYKNKEGRKYILNEHHRVMAEVKRRVFEGGIKRIIVNVPPGYSKTEEWVVNFMAEGLAINPQALFMHLSYSDDLARENSTKCKDIVTSPEYQELFNVPIRQDVSSKKKWYTKAGGGVYATSAGGQVTGFRAGRIIASLDDDKELDGLIARLERLEKRIGCLSNRQSRRARALRREFKELDNEIEERIAEVTQAPIDETIDEALAVAKEIDRKRREGLPTFWGALIIDDPIKPDDALSDPKRQRINNRFMNTFKSRLAVETETPIVLVMQRVHEEDPSGFLLTGGTGEKWHHLLLPVEIPEEPIAQWYPKAYTHGIPIEYKLPPGPLWKAKHDAQQIKELRQADPYTSSAQYDQDPKGGKALIFRPEYWRYYDELPRDIMLKRIYGDTAQKTGEHNDFTVFQCWGYSPREGIFLIDLFRAKLTSPELEVALKDFWNKHRYEKWVNPIGAQIIKLEDKSSGSGLIQSIQAKTHIPIEGIPRHRDKVMRALDCVPFINTGSVHIPREAPWLHDFKEEARKFSPLLTHKHDDQIDPMLDAINDMLIEQVNIYEAI